MPASSLRFLRITLALVIGCAVLAVLVGGVAVLADPPWDTDESVMFDGLVGGLGIALAICGAVVGAPAVAALLLLRRPDPRAGILAAGFGGLVVAVVALVAGWAFGFVGLVVALFGLLLAGVASVAWSSTERGTRY